jgi:hypothetical protein
MFVPFLMRESLAYLNAFGKEPVKRRVVKDTDEKEDR